VGETISKIKINKAELMPPKYSAISKTQIERRNYWVGEIEKLSGSFTDDFDRLRDELRQEIETLKMDSLLSHIRLCGAIPERYGHDSSEEKLYSKYTDALLSEAFNFIGLSSLVLTERADAADVECVGKGYSFVADAKAFRLSRTAKNQKDFKVQAMDNWKRGKPYAIVVCPIYQLPTRTSQIYQQAITRDVCVFSYSHLAVIVRLAESEGKKVAEECLYSTLKSITLMNPSKDSIAYWTAINTALLASHKSVAQLWKTEKIAAVESIAVAKEEALTELALERERILRMSKEQAVLELIRKANLDNRERVIKRVSDTGIMNLVTQ
jgi:type II restriction enzyme